MKNNIVINHLKDGKSHILYEYITYLINFLINFLIIYLFSEDGYGLFAKSYLSSLTLAGFFLSSVDPALYKNSLNNEDVSKVFSQSIIQKFIYGTVYFIVCLLLNIDLIFVFLAFFASIGFPLFFRVYEKFNSYLNILISVNLLFLLCFCVLVYFEITETYYVELLLIKFLILFVLQFFYLFKTFKIKIKGIWSLNIINNIAISSKVIPLTLVNNIILPSLSNIDAGIYKIILDFSKYSKLFLTPLYHQLIVKFKFSFRKNLERGDLSILFTFFNLLFLFFSSIILIIIYTRYGISYVDEYLIISIIFCYFLHRIKITNDTSFIFTYFKIKNIFFILFLNLSVLLLCLLSTLYFTNYISCFLILLLFDAALIFFLKIK
jgi:hypothetical protein